MSVAGSAGVSLGAVDDTAAATYGQSDSLTFTGSGETDSGLNVSVSFEIDGDEAGFDDRSFSVGNDSIGTFAFHGSGGSGVVGGWDDMTPSAYEEVWTGTTGASAT